jgi:RND family efflux transporter MFP subunit
MKKLFFGIVIAGATLFGAEIYATFTVQAMQSASLAFNGSGIVNKVNADVGDKVLKGDLLATLKSDDIRAGLNAAKVALKYAKKSYDRMQEVKDVTDKARLDGVEFKYENAKAQVAYKQALLDKTILKAPFDGVISMKNLEIGDTLSGMRMKIVYMTQSEHDRKLIVEFDQKYWKSIHPGLTFVYKVDGDDQEYKSKIVKIYPVADPKSRKLKAEVPAKDIPVGLFGEGKIVIDENNQKTEN